MNCDGVFFGEVTWLQRFSLSVVWQFTQLVWLQSAQGITAILGNGHSRADIADTQTDTR